MNRFFARRTVYLLLAASSTLLAGCGNAIRASDEQHTRPGALDPALPTEQTVYDQYALKFLNRFRVSYKWYQSTGCRSGGIPVDDGNAVDSAGTRVRHFYTSPIEREGEKIVRRTTSPDVPAADLTRFFRSVKHTVPVYAEKGGKTDFTQVTSYRNREEGWAAMCIQHWVGLNMSIDFRFFERTVDEWIAVLQSEYAGTSARGGHEMIGKNTWTTYTVPIQPAKLNNVSGPYKFYILPVGDSGFTVAFSLGANHYALSNPQGFVAMEALFRRILESMRIEPWTDQAQSEYEALRSKAVALQRTECLIAHARGERPARWCLQYFR